MPESVLDNLKMLQAVGDPRRLRIIEALAERDRDVEDLCAAVGLSQPAVSHHLRILKECGLVSSRRAGRYQDYRLLPAPFLRLGVWLQRLGQNPDNETQAARYRDMVIEDFLEQPLPRPLPGHPRKRALVARWFLEQLEIGRFYRMEELETMLAGQVEQWQTLLSEWQEHRELDGNGEFFRRP